MRLRRLRADAYTGPERRRKSTSWSTTRSRHAAPLAHLSLAAGLPRGVTPKAHAVAADKKTPDEYALMREMIVKGKILPNERLVEAHYAELLGSNRANIRGALARLAQEGLVVYEPRRGARVRSVTPEEAIEIFEVRGVLEVLLVRQAAERASAADKNTLDAALRKVQAALAKKDPMAVGSASRALREALWRISGHTTGMSILTTLNSQLVRIRYLSLMMPGRAEAIASALEDMVAAVRAGAPDKAVKAMRRYHDGSIAGLKKAMRSQESGLMG